MMDVALDNLNSPNYTYYSFSTDSTNYENISEDTSSYNLYDYDETLEDFIYISSFIVLVISIFGAVGNGVVIWLLGFCIKRNPFMTFILNLAVADFGVLLSFKATFLAEWFMNVNDIIFQASFFLFLLMYSASQFLLTAISIDRCVAIYFPLWHQCKRPPHLTTIVCAVLWALSVLLTASSELGMSEYFQFIVNAVLCLPAMTVATVFLFIKACLKSRQHQRGKLLTIVLLTLLFFLLFAFPGNIIYILDVAGYLPLSETANLLACLNSSVNPFIYFLVGRQWKSRRRESMKMVLQKVFKEEEGHVEETPVENQA